MEPRIVHPNARARIRGAPPDLVIAVVIVLVVVAIAGGSTWYLTSAPAPPITPSLGCPCAQATTTLGGSVSAYGFDELAAQQFEQNHSNMVLNNNQGGTGAGMLAVCHGSIDIGVTSAPETLKELESVDGCPNTAVIDTFAYDTVDVLVAGGNPHGLESIQWDTLAEVYDHASRTTPTLLSPSIDGIRIADSGVLNGLPIGPLAWDQIPACVAGATNCGGTGNPQEAPASALGIGVPCAVGVDVCTSPRGASPCGFTVCAGPYTGTSFTPKIETVAPSVASGWTGTFEARLLDANSSKSFAQSSASLGYSGCGSADLLSDCGISPTNSTETPFNVISMLANQADALGYAEDGAARAAESSVSIVPFLGVGQVTGATEGFREGGILPTPGPAGTIAAGVFSNTSLPGYPATSVYQYVTMSTPQGFAKLFLEFVLSYETNAQLAREAGETSVYDLTILEDFHLSPIV